MVVRHRSAVALVFFECGQKGFPTPGRSWLWPKAALLHLLHRKIVIKKKKKGDRQLSRLLREMEEKREKTALMAFPGLFPLSLSQTGSGDEPWTPPSQFLPKAALRGKHLQLLRKQ